jgi:hypothetical protein
VSECGVFARSIAASLPPEQSSARTLAALASAHATAKAVDRVRTHFNSSLSQQGDEAEYRNFACPTRYGNRIGGTRIVRPAGPRRPAVNFETEPTRIAQDFDVPQEDNQLSRLYIFIVLS